MQILAIHVQSQIPFENPHILNTENDLPSNNIKKLVEDEDGIIWIATYGGLVRYDGMTAETYRHDSEDSTSLIYNNINDILPDVQNGKVWVTTPRGLSVFDIAQKKFRNYRRSPNRPNGLPDVNIHSVFKDKDNQYWIGATERGILKYRPDTDDFEQYLCNGSRGLRDTLRCRLTAKAIYPDLENDSLLWLVGSGVIRFNRMDGDFQHFRYISDDSKEERYANSANSSLLHKDGKIYLGTWYHGVYVFDTKTENYYPLAPCYQNGTYPYKDKDVITNFLSINENEFWINSWQGAQLYNSSTNCITKAYNNSRKQDKQYSIDYIDKGGRIWSYPFNKKGIYILNPLVQQYEFLYFDEKDSPYNSFTRRVVEDTLRQRIYVAPSGISQGLPYYNLASKKWTLVLPTPQYLTGELKGINIVDIALLPTGELIILADDKIFSYRPGEPNLKLFPSQPEDEVIRFRACMTDSRGDVWIGAWSGGFYRLNPKTKELRSFHPELDHLAEHLVGGDQMAEDIHGNIWMRENRGLLIWEKEKDQFIYHPYDPVERKALSGMGKITAAKNGRVWIATNKDMIGYGHADSLDRGIIRYLGGEEGMKGSHAYLVKNHKDKLLVFTELGMQEFDPKAMRFGKFYDADYGLGSSVFSATWLQDGRLAVARRKAMALFHPDSLKTNEEQPVPYINSFRVFDDPYYLEGRPEQKDTVHLSYKQNFFSFEFSAVGYNLPDKTQFKYKLEGFDEKWNDGTKRRFAAYTNVPGGDYTFKVQAINSEGLSLNEPYELFIHVSTVWYKTIWFWCLAFLLLSGLAYLIYKWRINQVRKEERLHSEYERKLADVEMSALRAQMNPHFIFNSLNSIEYYIISNEPEKASDYLNRFSRLIRLILQNSKSHIVPLKDDLEALKLYIEMESMRFDNLFDYELKMESSIVPEKVNIPPMLLQPYVENAIWHGLMQKKNERGKLDLTIRQNKGHLVCLIEDNGIGREAAKQLKSKTATRRKSYGMKITSDRITMLNKLAGENATVNIYDLKKEDGTGIGTRVELVIPI